MMIGIKNAGQKATTGLGKRANASWYAKNENVIFAQTQTSMEAIRANQELGAYNVIQKNNITNLDKESYIIAKEGMVNSGLQEREFAEAKQEQDFAIIDRAVDKLTIGAAAGAGFDVWQGTVTPENPDGDLNAAFDAIDALDITASEKQDAESELKTRVTNRRAENRIALEQAQDSDLADINQLLYFDKDYDKATTAIRNSSLPEKAKAALFEDSERRALAKAKGTPLDNDRVEAARQYERSLDIWRGAISKREFDEDLIENAHKLDDEAFQRVSTSAANTLKSSQAEALSRANTEAGRLIVDRISDSAQAEFLAKVTKGMSVEVAEFFINNAEEKRQLQFWSLSRYNAELRQWVEENPDKLGKDFFQFSESLKHDYWNRSIEDLEALRTERETALDTEAEFDKSVTDALAELQGKIDRQPVVVGSKKDYDNLPSGTLYMDSQGRIAEKR